MEEVYAFGGNPLDRVSERRGDAAWVADLITHPDSRAVLLAELKPRVRRAGSPGAAPVTDWLPMAPLRGLVEAGATCVLLGLENGQARFAIDATGAALPPGEGAEHAELRGLAAVMEAGAAAVLGEARAILDWHARHRFCANCGTATGIVSAGWNRRCPSCKASHFPRTDPVVIMLPVRGDRALLGRNARRAGARFSCLAGFVEPGETLEEAVRREVFEEAGLRVGRATYVATQPWPFPSSLMCGFVAEALDETVTMDRTELDAAQWFTRDEVMDKVRRSAAGDGSPDSLAPPIAIGHQIARRWASGEF